MSMAKEIKGFPGYYITDVGLVYSRLYNKITNPCTRIKKLKMAKDKNGYLIVCLHNNGKQINKKVHRLVAEAFILNLKGKSQINHKNGIKTDNRVENLEWATSRENIIHKFKVLRIKQPSGKDNIRSKKILQIKNNKILARFYGSREAQDKTGVIRTSIGRCCVGKQKTAGGFIWKYE